MMEPRTSANKKAKQLAKYFRREHPDYDYLKRVFQHLREELEVEVTQKPKRLPYVPTEEEMKRYYDFVWAGENSRHMMIIKTFLYTGVRVSELVHIKLADVDLSSCQIRINKGKGAKDRMVPFPPSFRELLVMHMETMRKENASYLFESNWRKKYTDRGVRKILAKYSEKAGMSQSLSPHKLRHFLLTWLKKQGVDDAFIQPYSGHDSRKSLEVYSMLALPEAQNKYNEVMDQFPL